MCGFFMNKNLKIKMAEHANLPKDVLMGAPIVTMNGQSEMRVENYRGILEYTDCLIRIQTKIGRLKVCGKNLRVSYYTNDEMEIKGEISSVEYM